MQPKRLFSTIWLQHGLLILAVALINVPMCYAVLVGTQTIGETLSNPLLPGTGFLSNLEYAFQSNFVRFMVNSLFAALTVALGKTMLSLMAGFAFSFFDFRGKWLAFSLILFTVMIPRDVIVIALFRLVSGTLQLGNTFSGLVFPTLASAYGTLLFHQHLSAIPVELSEAAQLDGITPIQYLAYVLIPLSSNIIRAMFMISFIWGWNMYLWPLTIIGNPHNQVLQVGLQMIRGPAGSGELYGPRMVAALLASVPPLAIFLLTQGEFITGYTITREFD